MKPSDPGFWVLLIPVITANVIAIINAIRGSQIHKQIQPPSNGQTLGRLMESAVVASSAAAIDASRVRAAVTGDHTTPITPIEGVEPLPPYTANIDDTKDSPNG